MLKVHEGGKDRKENTFTFCFYNLFLYIIGKTGSTSLTIKFIVILTSLHFGKFYFATTSFFDFFFFVRKREKSN